MSVKTVDTAAPICDVDTIAKAGELPPVIAKLADLLTEISEAREEVIRGRSRLEAGMRALAARGIGEPGDATASWVFEEALLTEARQLAEGITEGDDGLLWGATYDDDVRDMLVLGDLALNGVPVAQEVAA